MDVKLVISRGKKAGQVVPVTGDRFFIGRAEDCHLRPNTDLVSRHHCVITVADDLVTIRDLGSRNGTFVNAERVRGEEEINNGDKIAVGPLKFEVVFAAQMADRKHPQAQHVHEDPAHTAAFSSPARGEDDEFDLNDLLDAESDTVHDTQKVEQTTTGTVAFDNVQNNTSGQSSSSARQEQKPNQAEGKKTRTDKVKQSGMKLRNLNKPKTADSQSAAADTLRHFFHRR